MKVLPFYHPRKLTPGEIAQNVKHILVALRRISQDRSEK